MAKGTVSGDGGSIALPDGRVVFAGGSDGSYGVVGVDHAVVERSGLQGIDTYPYNPTWVFESECRVAPADRHIEVAHLTAPRTAEAVREPADLAVTINGE